MSELQFINMLGLFVGFEPWQITHASDNFGKLYEFAVELIKRYVKDCTYLNTAAVCTIVDQ